MVTRPWVTRDQTVSHALLVQFFSNSQNSDHFCFQHVFVRSLQSVVWFISKSSETWNKLYCHRPVLSNLFETSQLVWGWVATTFPILQSIKVSARLIYQLSKTLYLTIVFSSFECSDCCRVFTTGRARSAHLCAKRRRDETSTRSCLGFSMVTLPINANCGVSEALSNEQERIIDILR